MGSLVFTGIVCSFLKSFSFNLSRKDKAYKCESEHEIEVKRVYVQESCRGRSIGGQMLAHLIGQLETGEFPAASVRLYKRYGFEQNMPESLCMGLDVTGHDQSIVSPA